MYSTVIPLKDILIINSSEICLITNAAHTFSTVFSLFETEMDMRYFFINGSCEHFRHEIHYLIRFSPRRSHVFVIRLHSLAL